MHFLTFQMCVRSLAVVLPCPLNKIEFPDRKRDKNHLSMCAAMLLPGSCTGTNRLPIKQTPLPHRCYLIGLKLKHHALYQSCVQFECHSRTLAFPSMTWFGKEGVNSWMWIEWDCSHQPNESPFSSMNWHSQCCTFKDQFECQLKIELSGMCECWFHSEWGTSLVASNWWGKGG